MKGTKNPSDMWRIAPNNKPGLNISLHLSNHTLLMFQIDWIIALWAVECSWLIAWGCEQKSIPCTSISLLTISGEQQWTLSRLIMPKSALKIKSVTENGELWVYLGGNNYVCNSYKMWKVRCKVRCVETSDSVVIRVTCLKTSWAISFDP